MKIQSIIKNKKSTVAYITDTEGDLAYFEKQISHSKVVRLNKNELEFTCENGFFVFGGNLFDRGSPNGIGGDLRLSQLLCHFKEAYPDRVFLIVGNRDANKTRFSTELPLNPDYQFDTLDITLPAFSGPKDTLRNYLLSLIQPSKAIITEEELSIINTPVNRLKWILLKTMGAPGAFEYRRSELAVIAKCAINEVSDIDVYLSFRLSVEPQALVTQFMQDNPVSAVVKAVYKQYGSFALNYLEHAQLACVINDALFVHGGVSSINKGKVPVGFTGFEPNTVVQFEEYTNALDWMSHLNDWYSKALDRWLDAGFHEKASNYQFSDSVPGAPLQHMAAGPGSKYLGNSVVVARFFINSNPKMPGPLAVDIVNYLHDSGLYYVIAGHQPHGDTPVYLKPANPEKAVTVITADTLYGHKDAYDDKLGETIRSTDPRGASLANVTLCYDSEFDLSFAWIAGSTRVSEVAATLFSVPSNNNNNEVGVIRNAPSNQ